MSALASASTPSALHGPTRWAPSSPEIIRTAAIAVAAVGGAARGGGHIPPHDAGPKSRLTRWHGRDGRGMPLPPNRIRGDMAVVDPRCFELHRARPRAAPRATPLRRSDKVLIVARAARVGVQVTRFKYLVRVVRERSAFLTGEMWPVCG